MKRRYVLLLVVAAACASDKYVHIETGSRSFYGRREEAERVDSAGMIHVKDAVTGKTVSLKRADCAIRSASKGEVNRARSQDFLYSK